MFWATSSLPVPFSPVMRIHAFEDATRAIICLRLTITGLSPTIAMGAQTMQMDVTRVIKDEHGSWVITDVAKTPRGDATDTTTVARGYCRCFAFSAPM